MDDAKRDETGTVGWFAFAAGTVGLARGQTLRLGIVNTSPSVVTVVCGLWSNPNPKLLFEHAHTLDPGQAHNCDLKASDVSKEIYDKAGRAQIRPLVRSGSRTIFSNVEVFDDETGRTSIILPLQEVVHRG
jgi:hypothetical protein